MPCCPETIIPFVNQILTSVGYGSSMIEKHGTHPQVTVLYFDEVNGGLVATGLYTRVAFQGNPPVAITVNHGGLSTGVIKIR